MALHPGNILADRYSIVRIIKSGGMSTVYEAQDRRLNNDPCAIKELPEKFLASTEAEVAEAKRRLHVEMKALAVLSHPDLPRVRDYFRLSGSSYIVMDLVLGDDLETELTHRLRTGRPYTNEEVVRDALQVLGALAYLHGQSPPVLHGNIKPGNLIREQSSQRVKLVDLGPARVWTGTRRQSDLGYTSPEQSQGRPETRSDLYSLGATMFHLISGVPPTPLKIPRLGEECPEVDPGLEAIVEMAVAPQAVLRFATAARMREALERWLQASKAPGRGAAARAGGAGGGRRVRARRASDRTGSTQSSQARTRLPVAAWIALALVLAGLGVWWGRTTARPRPLSPTPSPAASVAVLRPSPSSVVAPSPSGATPMPSSPPLASATPTSAATAPPSPAPPTSAATPRPSPSGTVVAVPVPRPTPTRTARPSPTPGTNTTPAASPTRVVMTSSPSRPGATASYLPPFQGPPRMTIVSKSPHVVTIRTFGVDTPIRTAPTWRYTKATERGNGVLLEIKGPYGEQIVTSIELIQEPLLAQRENQFVQDLRGASYQVSSKKKSTTFSAYRVLPGSGPPYQAEAAVWRRPVGGQIWLCAFAFLQSGTEDPVRGGTRLDEMRVYVESVVMSNVPF